MERHPKDLTTDEEIDVSLQRAQAFDSFPTIVEAVFFGEPRMDCLMLRLSDGRRLLIPREMLGELKDATPEQAADVSIVMLGLAVCWPQLDDGLYLPDFLEHRWGKAWSGLAA